MISDTPQSYRDLGPKERARKTVVDALRLKVLAGLTRQSTRTNDLTQVVGILRYELYLILEGLRIEGRVREENGLWSLIRQ